MSTKNKNLNAKEALKPLIIILGPTASGKSELALKLAKKFNSEIISADSRQIYKEMNIGTAKMPQDKKLIRLNGRLAKKSKNKKLKYILIRKTPHYLIDIIEPGEKFSVAKYKELAIKIIRDITRRGKIPILTGGTGLYISSIVDNIEIPKVKPNLSLRKKLENKSLVVLLKQLKKLDTAAFINIDKKNKRRIIRALEVAISTGKPFSAQKEKGAPLFDCLQIGLDIPREKLYKKIDDRVEKMFKTGLVNETKSLAKKYSWKLPAMSGIGYREIGMYLKSEITLEKTKELIKFATHNYVRRQMTWFKKDKKIKWVKPDSKNGFSKIVKTCKRFLNN
ncbi:MAG: tRNA (adenosine(37)-N6)-dimethylallyltransferase MiaA [bacterium]|nr:tRNA (adenosine(37)-N6)-dimethylallyltransferase MiaA [bacterium]